MANSISISREVAGIIGLACLVLAMDYFIIEISGNSASQAVYAGITIIFVLILFFRLFQLIILIFGSLARKKTP